MGNSLNHAPISPRLETITSLASALPGRPTVKTSITTQNSDAVRSTTEVLRTAFCLPTVWCGWFRVIVRAGGLRRLFAPVVRANNRSARVVCVINPHANCRRQESYGYAHAAPSTCAQNHAAWARNRPCRAEYPAGTAAPPHDPAHHGRKCTPHRDQTA